MDSIQEKIIFDITSVDLEKSSFRIKNPSPKLIELALEELIEENNTFEYVDSHPQILIDRILKLKPELAQHEDIQDTTTQIDNGSKRSMLSMVISWIVGLLLIFLSLGVLSSSILGGVGILIVGLIFLPPVHDQILSFFRVSINWIVKLIVALGFLVYSFNNVLDQDLLEFENNRENIISEIQKKLSEKDYKGASMLSEKYKGVPDDKEFSDLREKVVSAVEKEEMQEKVETDKQRKINEAKEEKKRLEEERILLKNKEGDLLKQLDETDKKDLSKMLILYENLSKGSPENKEYQEGIKKYTEEKTRSIVKELKKVKSSNLDKNIELYTVLVSLNPDNKNYSDKVISYTKKKEAEEKEVARKKVEEYEKTRLKERGLMWNYQESEEKMGRGVIKNAFVDSLNQVSFGFPYQGAQRARLQLRKHPKFGKDVILSIGKGQFTCNSYSGCKVSVRFDKGKAITYKASAPSDSSSTTVFIRNYKSFVSRAKKSKVVYVEAEFYQEGLNVFEFNTEGLKF